MNRKSIGKKLRFSVFERDGFICQYCGRNPMNDIILHVDHVVSVKNGGGNDIENLTTSCSDCNLGKGSKTTIRKGKTPEDIQKQLDETKERLEQVVAMNAAMKELGSIKEKLETEKNRWVEDTLGGGFASAVYDRSQKLLNSKEFLKLSLQEKVEALTITKNKHDKSGLKTIDDWVKYLRGVARNMLLSEEEQKILKLYFAFFQAHHFTQVDRTTKKLVIATSDLGIECHEEILDRVERELEEYSGRRLRAHARTTELCGIENYTASKSGYGLNSFTCDLIGITANKFYDDALS